MKKFLLALIFFAGSLGIASAQILPSFQFGIKGGVNDAGLNIDNPTFNNSTRIGYLGGFWARIGALGFNFQPELYATSKNVQISDGNGETRAQFTSIDVPLLFGGKVGAFGIGARFYTGPLVSLAINKDQSFSGALNNAVTLNYKNQNFAWQFGTGLDIKNLSIDLRYEAGITKQTYGNSQTRVSLFSLSLAVPLIKI
ncbi:PorT family protein [Mucilaginibacter sp. X4EP1]|uniref:PorT family protein n=1 Tax=Mucilaginibacter sp. X4EP1 TaxID=2723092 RepID=UPI002167FE05|nr:PorT family protein [Mucilaginibacter sp. X4EP1]MCS3813247.1 hypothetical protein [Mucilaginibacter sp. X4EP1]